MCYTKQGDYLQYIMHQLSNKVVCVLPAPVIARAKRGPKRAGSHNLLYSRVQYTYDFLTQLS